ncbi:MAG: hypothetical protein ACE5OZ_09615 [Candidatus Heimdallarchaeota archaeon]
MCLSQGPQSVPDDPNIQSHGIHHVELRLSCQCGNVLWIPFPVGEGDSSYNKEVSTTCQCGDTFSVEMLRRTDRKPEDLQTNLSIKIRGKDI